MKKNLFSKKQGSKDLSRRNFIGTMGAATAGFMVVPRNVLGGKGYKAPSDMINVAGIGIGARGQADIQGIADPDVPIVRPARTNTGQPYTAEQLAAQAAREAQRAANRPAGGQQQPSRPEREPRKLANIYALCDVDTEFAAHVFKGYPKAKVYTDWREMLQKEK